MMYHKNYQTSWSIWLTILQKYTKVAIWIHLFFQGLHHRQPASVFFWCETFLTRPEMGFPQKPAISMDVFAQWWAKSMTKPAKYFWAVLNCGFPKNYVCVSHLKRPISCNHVGPKINPSRPWQAITVAGQLPHLRRKDGNAVKLDTNVRSWKAAVKGRHAWDWICRCVAGNLRKLQSFTIKYGWLTIKQMTLDFIVTTDSCDLRNKTGCLNHQKWGYRPEMVGKLDVGT